MKVFSTVCGLLMTIITSSYQVVDDHTPLVDKNNISQSQYHDTVSMPLYRGNNSLLHHTDLSHQQHYRGDNSLLRHTDLSHQQHYRGDNSLLHHTDLSHQQHYRGNNSLLHHTDLSHQQHYRGNNSLQRYYDNMTKGKKTSINFRAPLLFHPWYLGSPGSKKMKDPHENRHDGGPISRFRVSGSVDASPTNDSAGNKGKTDSIGNRTDPRVLHKENPQGQDISDHNVESKTWAQADEDLRATPADSAADTTNYTGKRLSIKSFHKDNPLDQDISDGKTWPQSSEDLGATPAASAAETTDSISSRRDIKGFHKEDPHDQGLLDDKTWSQPSEDLGATPAVAAAETTDDNIESRWRTERGSSEATIHEISNESDASTLGLESTLFEDNRDDFVRDWNTPPIDYYKCGRCVCNASENGLGLQANCENLNLWKYPSDLSRRMTYLNLQRNYLKLEYNKLSYFTSLLTLDISCNMIIAVKNNTCNESLPIYTLDLSNNKIRTIDDNSFSCLPRLTHLYLQNNNIAVLTNFMLGGISRLRHLDLTHNVLKTLGPSSFNSTRHLRVLKLSSNKYMSYSAKTMKPRLFNPLKQLEVLHIQGFSEANVKYPTAALLELTNLRELSIDGVVIGKFEQNLTALKNLSILKLGVDGNCKVRSFNEDYFLGLHYLKLIHVAGCRPKSISPLAFKANKLLEELRYTGMDYEFDSLFESLAGLHNSSIKSLTISFVRRDLSKTACRFLGASHSKHMKDMPRLQELNLENNLISLIQYGFYANLPATIEKLNVRKNTLHYLRSVIALKRSSILTNLVEVKEDMQNGEILSASQENEDDSSETVHCMVEAGDVQPATPTPYPLCSKYIAENSISSPVGYVLPPKLAFYSAAQSFHFGGSVLSRSTEENKIRYFNISNVYMTDWGNRLLPHQIEVVDFSDNYCDYLKPSFFRANNSIKELHIAGNILGETFAKDENGDILSRLYHALFVDLSRNHIRYLPSQFFSGLIGVKVLDLSGNNLRIFNVSISHMKSLRFINLNQNSISWISSETRNDLDLVNMHQQVSIDLTSNRLLCTCDGIDVMKWLATTNVRILKKDFLECENENNQVMLVGNLNERLISLQQKCASKTLIVLIASFSVIIFLLITLSAWMFRNRWRLCYLRNIAITKLLGLKAGNETQDQEYRFDAYILHSTEDTNFVLKECLIELEEKRGHKLCVEDRAFSFGCYMPCAITSAISCSRVTVPIISPDFWDGQWCEYGVQIAVMEAIHTKRDVLHLMIYKPVCDEQMPQDLLKVLRDNSFCEYPPLCCAENVRTAFWDALSRSIGHAKIQDDADGLL